MLTEYINYETESNIASVPQESVLGGESLLVAKTVKGIEVTVKGKRIWVHYSESTF